MVDLEDSVHVHFNGALRAHMREKQTREQRFLSNDRHSKKRFNPKQSHKGRGYNDSPPKSKRFYNDSKKEPRWVRKQRQTFRGVGEFYRDINIAGTHEVTLPIQGTIPSAFKKSTEEYSEANPLEQQLYFLLMDMPDEAWHILADHGVIGVDEFGTKKAPEVKFKESMGYYSYSPSRYHIPYYSGEGVAVPAKAIEEILKLPLSDTALTALKTLGMVSEQRVAHSFGESSLEQELGVDGEFDDTNLDTEEVQKVIGSFYANQKNRETGRQVNWRTRSQVRKIPKRYLGGEGKEAKRIPKRKFDNRKKRFKYKPSTISYQAGKKSTQDYGQEKAGFEASGKLGIPEEDKAIRNMSSLFKACVHLANGRAKEQHFWTPNKVAYGAVRVMLKYVQSRVDKGRLPDINAVVRGINEVVSTRLNKWQEESGIYLISVAHLLGGEYLREAPSGELERVAQVDTENLVPFYVHKGYYHNPSRFVTNRSELNLAVRQVLSGEIGIDHFIRLDPRSRIILDFCERNRDYLEITVKDVVDARHPGLRRELTQNGLLNIEYRFIHWKNIDKSDPKLPYINQAR